MNTAKAGRAWTRLSGVINAASRHPLSSVTANAGESLPLFRRTRCCVLPFGFGGLPARGSLGSYDWILPVPAEVVVRRELRIMRPECPVCGWSFPSNDHLVEHFRMTHKTRDSKLLTGIKSITKAIKFVNNIFSGGADSGGGADA